jgi:hypothetical protein
MISVADPGCLSQIPDPAFLVIPYPRSYIKKREVQNKFNFFLPDQMITGTGTAVNIHT